MCPGTDVYMPPEAVQDKPVYTEKIDCFSFGVIIIQIVTQQFPKPENRLQEVELNHPGLPPGKVLVQAPEVNRRQNHISQIPSNHSLLPITLDCLKDRDNERPSAHQLCEKVVGLKETPEYIDSIRAVQDKEEVIRSLLIQMEKNKHTLSSKEEENQQLRQQLQQERDQANRQLEERERQLNQQLRQLQQESDKQLEEIEQNLRQVNEQLRQLQQERDQANKQLEERERQLHQESDEALRESRTQLQEREKQFGRVNQQLEASEQIVAHGQFERQISEPEQQLSQSLREQQKTKARSRGRELTSFKLRWRERKRAPRGMSRWCDAVVNGNTVYVTNGGTVEIYSYDVTSDSWSQLRDCVHVGSSIAIINGWLTTVGGYSYPTYSNELFSLTREGTGSGRRWTERFPPMPTKRRDTTALCTGAVLIVAGGRGDGRVLSTVEVMNTGNHQWTTTDSLPQPMYWASATLRGDRIYMLGGLTEKDNKFTKSVYTCSASALFQSCVQSSVQSSLEAEVERTSLVEKASIWRRVANLPVTQSTCESFHGRLLAIGGYDSTTAVYMMYSRLSLIWMGP